tara:strand:+ start:591 stop:1376 length:786 start_codon:yes stop_codon:yes gene_type:complete
MRYAKKSLGQNFLIDSNIIKKIINLTNVFNKNILEIGPGKGALTDEILRKKPKSLILIEKDSAIFKELKLKYYNYKNVNIYNKDFLEFEVEKELKKNTIIFGNLPYNISSQILVKIIKFQSWPPKYNNVIFMFQKEMADRIIGTYNTSKYGRLSILVNYRLNILKKFNVSSNCFFPKPKVDSSVLFFKPKEKVSFDIKNIENLEKITNILFSNKRKMINKNIKKIFNKDKLDLIKGINLNSRPSDLKPEKYYEITELFEKM